MWQKSSFCESGACVGVADADSETLMINTSSRDEPVRFSRKQFADLIRLVKTGEVDFEEIMA